MRRALRAFVVGATMMVSLGLAHGQQSTNGMLLAFNIHAQPMESALTEFGSTTGLQVLFDSRLTKEHLAPAVVGSLSAEEALKRLLKDSQLHYVFVNAKTVAIRASDSATLERAERERISYAEGPVNAIRLAQIARTASVTTPTEGSGSDKRATAEKEDLEEVVVTGSHIAGAPPTSPLLVFTQEDFAKAGATTATQFLGTLTQQFSTRSAQTSAITPSNFDASFGSAVNLRGLGSGSTLVLVNGRRPAAAGSAEYVDVSMIPLSAVERIEVLTDGASAIYGSDAVGGVVNFVLRKQFSGASTLVQFGETSHGDGEEYRLSQMLGTGWHGGSVLVNYEYYRREPISSLDRDYSKPATSSIDLQGTDRKHSFYVSGRNTLIGASEVFADLSYTEHNVLTSNVSDLVGPANYAAFSRQYGTSLGFTAPLRGSWKAEIVANWSRNELDSDVNFFGAAVASTSYNTKSAYSIRSVGATASGNLLRLPAGDSRLAVGLEYRDESYDARQARLISSGTGGTTFPRESSRTKSAFFELSLPVISGVVSPTLLLSLAGRYEDHTQFGNTFNPKVGLAWAPTRTIKFRATRESSFKVPTLYQLNPANGFVAAQNLPDPSSPTGRTRSVVLFGNNPDLTEETAHTWNFGGDFDFQIGKGLRFSASYFDTRYKSRIQAPPGTNTTALTDATLADLALRRGEISDAEFNALVASRLDGSLRVLICPPAFRDPITGACHENPANFAAIVDRRLVNVANLKTSGIDLSASQIIGSNAGDFEFELNATRVLRYETQVTDLAQSLERVGMFGTPVKWRARGGATWRRRAWTAGTYINYVDDYINDLNTSRSQVSSWTTVDLHLRYEFSRNQNVSALRRVTLGLNVENLFDRDPPYFLYPATNTQVGYDPINANPFGRQYLGTIRLSW